MPNIMATRWCRLYRGTPAEIALEDAVASLGVPYRNQFPCFLYGLRFFLDFALPTLGLVIEVDDPSHTGSEKQIADDERTAAIGREFGWRVVRCTNGEALEDPHGTVKGLLKSVGLWPIPEQPTLCESLPDPKRAPRRNRRAAKAAERLARRVKSSARPQRVDSVSRPARPPRTRQSPPPPTATPPQVQALSPYRT